LPAVTIPSGFGPRGLPLGFQIVGRYREDERALQVAAWAEAALAFTPGLAGSDLALERPQSRAASVLG